MSRRKPIDAKILEASKKFDAHMFIETVKGVFSDFPDYRRNQKRVLYPTWYLSLVVLCGFFCGCNSIEEIADYADLQEDWFSSLLGETVSAPSHGALWWFLVKTPPDALKSYFHKWFSKIPGSLRDQLLAIDGKRLKGARNLSKHIARTDLCGGCRVTDIPTATPRTDPRTRFFLYLPSSMRWEFMEIFGI